MAFHEIRFPNDIAYGSAGGPERKTEIITLDSGFEQRNTAWAQSRHKFNVAYGVKTYDQLLAVKKFWEARNGPLHSFRYKDWSDYKSCDVQQQIDDIDQLIGTGTGALTTFQLVKTYSDASGTYIRTINKPVAGTVRIALNNVEQLSGWTVNTVTGVVTFSVAPGNGVTVKAGYEFDVPVRFESEKIVINLEAFVKGNLDDINLVEVRVKSDGSG